MGEGTYPTSASSSADVPIAARPEVHSSGATFPESTALRSPSSSSSWVSVPASKKRSISASSASATISISCSRAVPATSLSSKGTGPSVALPLPSDAYVHAFMPTRSMTPPKPRSSPMGNCTGMIVRLKASRTEASVRSRLERSRSRRLTTTSRGSPSASASAHTFSVCTSTPETASTTTSAASATRRPARASDRKLPMPGVSMKLILVLFHSAQARLADRVCFLAISSSS